jgi:hypothetical protein
MSRKTRVFRAGGGTQGNGEFGHGQHTAWEEFQNDISSRKYQTVVSRSMFPKRKDFGENDNAWETTMASVEEKATKRAKFR